MTAAELARERRKQKLLAQEANLNKGFIGTAVPEKQKEETAARVEDKEFLMEQIKKRKEQEAREDELKNVSKKIVEK